MPSEKTECTELSIGFGLLGIDPHTRLAEAAVSAYFADTLTFSKYDSYIQEFSHNEEYYYRFFTLGLQLRNSYPLFKASKLNQVQWDGPNRAAGSVTISQDLLVLNTAVSVKATSDVANNPSTQNLFVRLPQGRVLTRKKQKESWYIKTAPEEYQALYSFAKNTWCPDYPDSVIDYHKRVKKPDRLILAAHIDNAECTNDEAFQRYHELYVEMCNKVSACSAQIFNQHLAESEDNPDHVIRNFCRIGEQKYILCGLDDDREFAVEIPSISTFIREWRVKNVHASPDREVDREQAVVKFYVVVEHIPTHKEETLVFHDEIRWSHRRFNGCPEAKLYKDFLWTEVPFFKQLIEEEKYKKLDLIGEGGFGHVYQAKQKRAKKVVAYKELISSIVRFQEHEYERFQQEVAIQSALQHPNIVPILDHDLSASPPWFTMPLAQDNLAEWVEENGAITDHRLLNRIYRQILDGVSYAHSQNVIHRDLKPENILLFEKLLVKIGDFGLGKLLSPGRGIALTGSSDSLGSLYYAAPEQLESTRNADFRSDIYSLGKILYYCLTNSIPYPSLKLNSVVPLYREIIATCTADDPAERFQSVDSLISSFKGIQ